MLHGVAGLHGVSMAVWWRCAINRDVLYNRGYVAAVPHSRLWSMFIVDQ